MAKKHFTSWDGTITDQIQRQIGSQSFYTRYVNRKSKSGLEVVRPRKWHLDIYKPVMSGNKVTALKWVRREPKYRNYSGDDPNAKKTFKTHIKKPFMRVNKRRGKNIRIIRPNIKRRKR